MNEEMPLEFYQDDFALFIETGFIAVKYLDEIAARRLFKAAESLYPENVAPKIGLGYIELHKMRIHDAAFFFEQVLQQEPDHHLAKALLGITYTLTKDKQQQGEALLLEAQQADCDPSIHHLALISLDWLKKELQAPRSILFSPSFSEKEESNENNKQKLSSNIP